MGPHFLCIGAMKSGTSWLSYNLRFHPKLWTPPVKELHYFNHFDQPRGRGVPIFFRDVNSRRRLRKYFKTEQSRREKGKEPRPIGWAMRYFLMPTSERWYRSLFPVDWHVSGEATPGYSTMSPEIIAQVHAAMPDLKIIYLLRNPVHRDWSHASMWLERPWRYGKKIAEASDEEISQELANVERSGGSDYVGNLERWEQFYPRDRFFVAFFEEIERDPAGLLTRIFTFLGVDTGPKYIGRQIRKKVGAGSYSGLPDRYASMLAARNYEKIVQAHRRFDNAYTRGWLDYANQYIDARQLADHVV
jgi:hypothetical protein